MWCKKEKLRHTPQHLGQNINNCEAKAESHGAEWLWLTTNASKFTKDKVIFKNQKIGVQTFCTRSPLLNVENQQYHVTASNLLHITNRFVSDRNVSFNYERVYDRWCKGNIFSSSAFKPVLLQVTWSMHLILFAKHSNQMEKHIWGLIKWFNQ